jgi:hypothetical protein
MTSTFTKISFAAVVVTVVFGVFSLVTNTQTINSAEAWGSTCGSCGGGSTGGGSTGGGSDHHDPIIPACSITATPASIVSGNTSTLKWTTTNAISASLNQSIGTVGVGSNITRTVSPTGTLTYTMTVHSSDGHTASCATTVTVTVPVPAPTCTLTATPTSIVSGHSSQLTWTSTNAVSGSVDQGVGAISLTNTAGVSVAPTVSKTYTMTVTNSAGVTAHCAATITVTPVPAPTCTLTATPTEIVSGGTSKLMWTSVNAVSGTIDQGVGAVNPNNAAGFRNVMPTVTKTYTLTVLNSAGVSATCHATVTVTPVVVNAPTCTLSANPTSIVSGNNSQLTWTSANAVTGSIDQGVGAISLTNTAGQSVAPTASKTYTMTVTNSAGVTATCAAAITVTTPTPDAPVCEYFRANPTTINRGDTTVLSWSSIRATSASINNGVGSVSVAGIYTVSPLESTTYTLSLAGAGGTAQCTVPVTVIQPHSNSLSCGQNVNFTADVNSIYSGQSTVLHWDINGVSNVSITDLGSVAVDGSQSVSPTSDRTYTLTASNGSDSISCPFTIYVSRGSHHSSSPSPRCSLSASDTSITLGERTTLTWTTGSAFDLTLKDDSGKTLVSTLDRSSSDKSDLFDGEMTLRPEKDTTYTLHAERGSSYEDCRVDVKVASVVVSQVRDQQPLVSGIALTQVPYTGFEAGPIMTFIFYGLLALWALYLAYVLVVRRNALSFVTGSIVSTATPVAHIDAADVHGVFTPSAVATPVFHQPVAATPVATAHTATIGYDAAITDAATTEIENAAHAAHVLLSADAVQTFVAATPVETRLATLATVLTAAKGTYPTEDGWVILGEERMRALLAAQVA